MKLKKINITQFRHLQNLEFDFGKVLTVIAGGNGIGKTSLLGIIGHVFKYGPDPKNLFSNRFETKYSQVFRFSRQHDTFNYKYRITFDDGTSRNAELRIVQENNRTRHRIDVGGRVRGGGKIKKPVIYLSLKRLIPLAEERTVKLGKENLDAGDIVKYNTLYNRILSTTESIIPIHTKSSNKYSFSPTTGNYDVHGISSGQDNLGQIILAILSFEKLKETQEDYEGGVLLIDEIDATLYPAAQKNLLKILLEKGQELDLQIIFTTHSSDIMNLLASRRGSRFKNHTNFVGLTNSLGNVEVKQGQSELKSILADINHEAISLVQPKKINVYFEDNEAKCFYAGIVNTENLDCDLNYKDSSISCGTYKTLIDKGFEEFFRSIVVLDGDFKETMTTTDDNTLVFLPGEERPENIVKDFLSNLPEDDSFWDNEFNYTKRVFLQNIDGVANDRVAMKRWFNEELKYWGIDGTTLFKRWADLNPDETTAINIRTQHIVNRILENYIEVMTN